MDFMDFSSRLYRWAAEGVDMYVLQTPNDSTRYQTTIGLLPIEDPLGPMCMLRLTETDLSLNMSSSYLPDRCHKGRGQLGCHR